MNYTRTLQDSEWNVNLVMVEQGVSNAMKCLDDIRDDSPGLDKIWDSLKDIRVAICAEMKFDYKLKLPPVVRKYEGAIKYSLWNRFMEEGNPAYIDKDEWGKMLITFCNDFDLNLAEILQDASHDITVDQAMMIQWATIKGLGDCPECGANLEDKPFGPIKNPENEPRGGWPMVCTNCNYSSEDEEEDLT